MVSFQTGRFELAGDASLSRRPMGRVVEPLARMGASIASSDGRLPLVIEGRELRGTDYTLPVASAQVKSAVLLAALGAAGETTVHEPVATRDHTELMLAAAGAQLTRRQGSVTLAPDGPLHLPEVAVPGDISSAAPFLVLAALLPGSLLTVHDVGLNPLRAGILDVLERMGVRVGVFNRRRSGGELVGDVEVGAQPLVATRIEAAEVPRLVDELPLVALLGSFAHGTTEVSGAEELRAKESDRIETVTAALRAIGVRIEARPDGFVVRGVPARPRGGTVDACGDHRVAMLGAIAGLVSREGVRLEGAECVAVSFPGFFDLLDFVSQPMIVAIDGPAGAGKSTVARGLAARLGFRYLDTGAMYRSVTWLALQRGLPLGEEEALGELARRNPISFDQAGRVFIGGTDVTAAIRQVRVDRMVPVVARHPGVREVMRARQRELAGAADVVIEGRDIGTVVAPEAEVKVYLLADPAVRARRRESERPGIGADALATDLKLRDESDQVRMQPAPDAETIDTTHLGIDEVIARIEELVRVRLAV